MSYDEFVAKGGWRRPKFWYDHIETPQEVLRYVQYEGPIYCYPFCSSFIFHDDRIVLNFDSKTCGNCRITYRVKLKDFTQCAQWFQSWMSLYTDKLVQTAVWFPYGVEFHTWKGVDIPLIYVETWLMSFFGSPLNPETADIAKNQQLTVLSFE